MVGVEKHARGIRTRTEKESYSAVTTCPLEMSQAWSLAYFTAGEQ